MTKRRRLTVSRTVASTALLMLLALAAPSASQEAWGDHRPVVSPDGRTLVFMSNRSGTWSMYLMPIDGSTPPSRVSDDPRGEWYADWSPDGSSLVYSRPDPATGTEFMVRYNVRTGREYSLGPTDGKRDGPRWAQDGSAIYYRCDTGICRMTPDGDEMGVAFGLNGRQHDPALSRDGQWFAYIDRLENDVDDAFIMRTDGSERRRLTDDPGRTYGLDWSPDGRYVCYNTEVDGNAEIFVYDTTTGQHRRLTTDPGEDHLPRWSPDGSYLVFTSDRSGVERIYRIAPDGTGLSRIDTSGG